MHVECGNWSRAGVGSVEFIENLGRDTEGREVVSFLPFWGRGSRRLGFQFHKGTMREGISVFVENPRNIGVLPFTNYDNDNAHSVDSQ